MENSDQVVDEEVDDDTVNTCHLFCIMFYTREFDR